MTTSGTYTFGNTQLDELVRESYERIGIVGDVIVAQKVQSAITSLNLTFSAWVNKGLNLFLRQQNMMDIVPGQLGYFLPPNTVDTLEVTVANTSRQLFPTGVPFSSGGNANNAFDGIPGTFCDTGSSQGIIGYGSIGVPYSVNYVGIVSETTTTYDINVQYSFDDVTYQTALYIPSQSFIEGQRYWFVIGSPISAPYWQIAGTSNNLNDLVIQELYFNVPALNQSTNVASRILTRTTWDVYMSISEKYLVGEPSMYLIDRANVPTLKLWPVPNDNFQQVIYNTSTYIQDITALSQNMAIPLRFYEAAIAELSARLSLKFAPEKYQLLKAEAAEAYEFAASEDYERGDMTFQPDMTAYIV